MGLFRTLPCLKNRVWTFTIASWIFFAIHSTNCLTKPSSVKLVNNGYEGVVVAIRDDVPESEHLIQEIKDTLINASTYLYQATRKRAFFRNITILLPQTWSNNYNTVSPENSTYEAADVIVTPLDPDLAKLSSLPPPPFCKHFEGCGKQAAFIHFSSEFLTRNISRGYYGDVGRLLIHEWGHYRWGLFNEYPDETADPTSEEFFYSLSGEEFKATRCSSEWDDVNLAFDNETRTYHECNGNQSVGYEEGCFSVPTLNQTNATGSIMYGYTNIEQITQYCDNDTKDPSNLHVTEAPNKHNRLCETRSSWEIMRQHPDFSDGNNQPSDLSEVDIIPTVVLAKAPPLRLVLVLDTSGSMGSNNRILKQATLSQNFLLTGVVEGVSVGIVSFSREGNILSRLVTIDSDDTRRTLASKIPTTADGGTCIGCGLEKALEILQDNNQRAEGGVVLLITDGEDSTGAERETERMKKEYEQKKVKIHGVAFGENADNVIPELASTTGGNFFFQTDDIGSTGLHDAFSITVERQSPVSTRSLRLYTESLNVSQKGGGLSDEILIDPSIGNMTTFEFIHFYKDRGTVLEVNITSPSGEVITKTSPGYREEWAYGFVIVEVNGTAEPGWWQYDVTPNFSDVGEVLITISSLPSTDVWGVISATAEMSSTVTNVDSGEFISIFSDVRKGSYPVLNCTVKATVERPNATPFELQLLDNGAGADVTAGDGIYSRYFTGYTDVGYYGVKITVHNYDEGAIIDVASGQKFSRAQLYVEPSVLLSDDISKLEDDLLLLPGTSPPPGNAVRAPSFMRQTSGGSNRVTSLPNHGDFLPPSKITDFKVASTSYNDKSVTLTFTAPGGDLDYGKADYYVFQSSTSGTYDEIRDTAPEIPKENFIQGNSSLPANFGSLETFVVNVTFNENDTVSSFYFITRAYDKAGNAGKPSNLVQATLRKYIPESVPAPSTTAETATPLYTLSTSATPTSAPKEPIPSENEFLLVALLVAVGVFLFIFIFIIVFICQKVIMRNNRRQLWKDHTSDVATWGVEEHAYDNELEIDERMFEMNPIDRAVSVYSQVSIDGVVQEPIISPQIYDESTLEGHVDYPTQHDDVDSVEFSSWYGNSGYAGYALGQYISEDESGSSYSRLNGPNFLPYVTRTKYDPSFDKDNIPGQYF